MLKTLSNWLAGAALLALSGLVQAENYDYLLLASSWEPGFCATHQGNTECANLSSTSFAGSHLSLHGLWPNNYDGSYPSYCGVPQAQINLDRAPTWCSMANYGLSSAMATQLSTYMPGAASCLDKHEWYKHGTCSDQGTDPNSYWATADWLVAKLGQTSFNKFIASKAGKYVSRSQLLAAFETSFGSGSAAALSLLCSSSGGKSYLTEARIALDPAALGDFPAGSALVTDAGTAGTCPSSNIYIARP
ncbi:hypothetical protein [Chitinimonas sp.]|uniref:ribonuclease T2 family protein n=1 Tax=Chitinimonas sp. TaxID=1934313 RepID=UPI0035B1D53D